MATTAPTLRDQLAAKYISQIGYDPFEDDPTITEAEVASILADYDAERAAEQESEA